MRAIRQREPDPPDAGVRTTIAEELFNLFRGAGERGSAFLRLLALGRLEEFDFANTETVQPAHIRHSRKKRGEQGQKDLR